MTHETRDEHTADPNVRWTFDAGVTENFEAMLRQSIPGYDQMRALTYDQASRALADRPPGARVLDLGASRGDSVAQLLQDYPRIHADLCEISQPMIGVLQSRFGEDPRVDVRCADLSEDVTWIRLVRPHLVLSVLTLMFVPIENRQRVVQACHDGMEPGGTMIVVEKTLGDTAASQEHLVDSYHAFKMKNGYTLDKVERKRMSLKGSLVPLKSGWTEQMLTDAGFVNVQQYFRALQFVGWIARKPS